MSRLTQFLDQSRIASVIEQVEKGEQVDTNRVLALQSLDIARAGELFAIEVLESEGKADDSFGESVAGGGNG